MRYYLFSLAILFLYIQPLKAFASCSSALQNAYSHFQIETTYFKQLPKIGKALRERAVRANPPDDYKSGKQVDIAFPEARPFIERAISQLADLPGYPKLNRIRTLMVNQLRELHADVKYLRFWRLMSEWTHLMDLFILGENNRRTPQTADQKAAFQSDVDKYVEYFLEANKNKAFDRPMENVFDSLLVDGFIILPTLGKIKIGTYNRLPPRTILIGVPDRSAYTQESKYRPYGDGKRMSEELRHDFMRGNIFLKTLVVEVGKVKPLDVWHARHPDHFESNVRSRWVVSEAVDRIYEEQSLFWSKITERLQNPKLLPQTKAGLEAWWYLLQFERNYFVGWELRFNDPRKTVELISKYRDELVSGNSEIRQIFQEAVENIVGRKLEPLELEKYIYTAAVELINICEANYY